MSLDAMWTRVAAATAAAALLMGAAPRSSAEEVVVYTSVDQEFAEVVLKEAEAATGLKIQAVFDAEAAKTVGLERRLLNEKARPKADVFWNSEYLRSWNLGRQGVFAPPPPAASLELPPEYVDAYSVGLGLRVRVIACNTTLVPAAECPRRLEDLALPKWKGKVAVARPLFGTTATHFAALHAQWGEARFTGFLKGLKQNQVSILPGNGDVRDAVVAGRAAVGLTDTDDALGAIRRKQPLMQVFPDQDSEGAFSVFQTLGQVKGGPNPAGAQKLVAYLSSDKVEQRLIELGAVQIPVRASRPMAPEMGASRPKLWSLPPAKVEASLSPSISLLKSHLL